MTFNTLGLSDALLRAVKDNGYTKPTPIQQQAIPAILADKDVMAAAQTGTGKTAGFTLPLLQLLSYNPDNINKHPRALVLVPTRELADQVQKSIQTYSKYLKIRSMAVFGGVNIRPQIKGLKKGTDILVATPGRLLDLGQQKAVRFHEIETLILDEADRMLDMGFMPDIKRILGLLQNRRQTLMFSATFSRDIRKLAKGITRDPVEIDVAPRNSAVATVAQMIHPVDKSRKAELLSHLIKTRDWYQVLVFSRTKHGADKLVKKLGRENIRAEAIHGNKSQAQRTRALANFKRNKNQVLVATDIASRGLDIEQLGQVVNFDLPHQAEDYVHRIGRTGRAGARGHAISLVSADEVNQLRDIETLIKQNIERKEIKNFEPDHLVPASNKKAKPEKQQQRTNKAKPRRKPRASMNRQQARNQASF